MKNHRYLIAAISAALIISAVLCAGNSKKPSSEKTSEYVGSKLCLACHIKFAKTWPELPHSKKLLDPAEKGPRGCEACHGPGRKHTTTDRQAIIRFGKLTTAQKDDICLKCHAPKVTADKWKASGHARQELSCTLCHDMHKPDKPAKMLRKGFDEGCRCHAEIRAKAENGEHHKLPEWMNCTACHTPHGSENPSGLIKPKAELCKGCHGE